MIGGSVDVDVPCSLNIHSFSGTVGAKEILYQVGKTTYFLRTFLEERDET